MRWIGRRQQSNDAAVDGQSGSGERAMVAGIRSGDASAFDAMVVDHYQALLRLAFSYLGVRESAEEVVQEVFLRIWEQRAQWSPAGSVRPYLFTATRNGAISQLRHGRVEQGLVAASRAGASPDVLRFTPAREHTDDRQRVAELDAAIRAAIERLSPRMREAFVLSRQQHLSHDEIARVMGTSIKTVQAQIGGALQVLRRDLADWLE
jgi:RNA polymerase sigma-70 factor (ECF subfamily)